MAPLLKISGRKERHLVYMLKDSLRKARRLWRRQRLAAISLAVTVVITMVALSVFFWGKMNAATRVFRQEEVWTYSVFGLASVVGLMVSILILMNQSRRRFGDSEELMEQLSEIARDASENGSPLSILYPSPNPGQWSHIFRGHGGFERLRRWLVHHAKNISAETRICMLPGSAEDPRSALGEFVTEFNRVSHIPGEPIKLDDADEAPLGKYQREARAFFDELSESRYSDVTYIHEDWMKSITEGWLIILAAGHSLGFVGYMTLKSGSYRFEALPLAGSAGFLHGLYDALKEFYGSQPPSVVNEKHSGASESPDLEPVESS